MPDKAAEMFPLQPHGFRRTFAGKGPYFSFEQTQNAIRAEKINYNLDQGRRVFGDDGPETKGTEYEIAEAVEPMGNGIGVITKCGKYVTIYAHDMSDAVQKRP